MLTLTQQTKLNIAAAGFKTWVHVFIPLQSNVALRCNSEAFEARNATHAGTLVLRLCFHVWQISDYGLN